MKNILKYLRRTRDIFLIYGGSDLKLEGYTDSSFQSDPDDSKSISGYIFTLYGGAVGKVANNKLLLTRSLRLSILLQVRLLRRLSG